MTLFIRKGYCGFVIETLKKSYWKGVRSLSCQAALVKHDCEKKRKILLEEPNAAVQCSYYNKTSAHIWYFLEKELKISSQKIHFQLSKMSARSDRSVAEIKAVIDFLRNKGYNSTAIAESVQICFYTIENIQKALQMIVENEEKLSRAGLFDGLAKNKKRFTHGTFVRNKKLQLCLYYMELPYEFTGHGSFD